MYARRILIWALVIACCGFAACDDNPGDVYVETTLNDPNVAPSIALTGPDFPGNAYEAVDFERMAMWVVVSDGNGLDDIAGVFMTIGSITINGMIARPDASSSPPSFCDHEPAFVDNNDVDISSALPATAPGFSNIRLGNDGGGVYVTPGMIPSDPDFMSPSSLYLLNVQDLSADFTDTDLTCGGFYQSYAVFMVNPPTVSTAQNVFITYVDITLRDISVTVYDAAGAAATVTFPDINAVWGTKSEGQTAP